MGTPRPITLEYKKVGAGVWRKWNPVQGIWSELRANYQGGKLVSYTVRRWHPPEILEAVLDRNVAMQNSWKGKYGDDCVTQQTAIPIALHQQIMDKCGFQQGHGYDEKKFRQIMNDSDYRKLKTVPGRI